MAFGAPAQNPAGEIGDIGHADLAQDLRGLRGPAAGAGHPDDRAVARELAGALGQFAERDQYGATNVAERAVKLSRLADIEDLNRFGMLFKSRRNRLPRSRRRDAD